MTRSPIELFWTAKKNHETWKHHSNPSHALTSISKGDGNPSPREDKVEVMCLVDAMKKKIGILGDCAFIFMMCYNNRK